MQLRLTPLLIALTCIAPAGAQKLLDRDKPFFDSANDPYTVGGTAEIVAAAGYVNFGEHFDFGAEGWTSERVQNELDAALIFLESAHFRIGVQLPKIKVDADDRNKIRAELTELQKIFPTINPKTRYLDPWMRAHLTAWRIENTYQKFVDFMGVDVTTFPDGSRPWNLKGKYMGQGPYLGEKGKYELLVLPSESQYTGYMRAAYGLTTKKPQRWNIIPRDVITFVVHLDEGKLKKDAALHNAIIFNLAINFLDGYKHYSYEAPIWLREGIGHWFERENDKRYNSFDSSEGGTADMYNKVEWEPGVMKMIQKDDAPRMAQLVAIKNYAELTTEHHLATWSLIDFFVRAHPEFLPKLIDRVKGLMTPEGFADGKRLYDEHRLAFKEELGMTYQQTDRAWTEWVQANYSSK